MQTRRGILKHGWLMLLLTVLMLAIGPSLVAAKTKELWLMGGAIMPCPEMEHAQCQRDEIKDRRRFVLDDAALARVNANTIWPPERENSQILSRILLRHTADRIGPESLDPDALWQHISQTYISRSGKDLSKSVARNGLKAYTDLSGRDPVILRGDLFVSDLTSWEKNLIVDQLVSDSPNYRARQTELLQSFAESVRAFHQQQGTNTSSPKVLIMSSAREHAMLPVDGLSHQLGQLGLQASWLPLDSASAIASDRKQCDNIGMLRAQHLGRMRLEHFHPELAAQQLQACHQTQHLETAVIAADALLILDGSLALLQSSLFDQDGLPYQWTKVIRQRFDEGALFVGAVGAGAQLVVGQKEGQSIPVMQADESETGASLQQAWCQTHACGAGHHSAAGLGLFNYGTIDTYTADKGREYRLLRAAASGAGIGVGIDDGTALHLRWRDSGELLMRVAGQGTVLLVDTREADYDAQDKDWTLRQAKLSRLVPGTIVQVKNGDYRLAMPETHAGKAQQLIPPNRLIDPFFFRSWAQWFVANELPYAEAEYHVRPVQALLRLQRPKDGFRFYISDNGLVGFGDLIADLSFDRL